MKRYTLGFVFNADMSRVLLMHKLTPEWQKGKINGIGGKIEPGESPDACIAREAKEEADLTSMPQDWTYLGVSVGPDWEMHIYMLKYEGGESDARSMEREKVEWFDVAHLPERVLSNLHWMINFAIDKAGDPALASFIARYTKVINTYESI